MCMVCQVVYATTAGATLVATASGPATHVSQLNNLQQLPAATAKFAAPKFEKPAWY